MPRWLLVCLIPAAVTLGGGLVHMDATLARLETSVAEMDRRLTRIENRLEYRADANP